MSDKHSPKRFVTVFSTEQAGKFVIEFREISRKDDNLYTVGLLESEAWESAIPVIGKFIHGGDFDISGALL